MKTLKIVEVANEQIGWRSELKQVLNKWVSVQRAFISQTEGTDLPYWYNERANVGFLAAASWKAGFPALEEFSVRKGPRGAAGKNGRGDLRLELDAETAFIEAKITWPQLTNPSKGFPSFWKWVDKRILDARRDAKKPQKWSHGGEKRIGIVFAVPWISEKVVKRGNADEIRSAFLNSLDPISQNKRIDFWAAYMPGEANQPNLLKVANGRLFPGVILLGSTVGS